MFPLDNGGGIVDTPGMREFGLWLNLDEGGIASLFVKMRPYVGVGRFGLDCTHTHEPGCSIKDAVKEGWIASARYRSYVRMLSSHRSD